jgi:hypothetical protein
VVPDITGIAVIAGITGIVAIAVITGFHRSPGDGGSKTSGY